VGNEKNEKGAAASSAAVAPVAAPAASTSVVIHQLDAAQFKALQKTLLLSAMVGGKVTRADLSISPANWKKLSETADVLMAKLAELEG
jgi:hypothetical protein